MPNARIKGSRYTQKTELFGDGHDGAATQVHRIYDRGKETDMTVTWSRQNRRDPGAAVYRFGEEIHPDSDAMIRAYEKSLDAGDAGA